MVDTEKPTDKEKTRILQVYAVLGVTLVLSLLPYMSAAIASLSLGFVALIAAYVVRAGRNAGEMTKKHMTFIIRTIWIGSLIAFVVMIAGSVYLYVNIDNSPLEGCAQRFMAMGDSIYDWAVFKAAIRPCQDAYIQANMRTFITSGIMIAAPVLGYFIYRLTHGVRTALAEA